MCSIIILLVNIDQYCDHFYSPLSQVFAITFKSYNQIIWDNGYAENVNILLISKSQFSWVKVWGMLQMCMIRGIYMYIIINVKIIVS